MSPWLVSTHDVVRDGLGAADLVRGGRLVPGGHGHHGPGVYGHETPGLGQLLGQHGAALGLHAAVEVAGHVVRHRAVFAAVPLETGLMDNCKCKCRLMLLFHLCSL